MPTIFSLIIDRATVEQYQPIFDMTIQACVSFDSQGTVVLISSKEKDPARSNYVWAYVSAWHPFRYIMYTNTIVDDNM